MCGGITTFSTLGENRGAPRFWVEGRRLEALGFAAGVPIACEVTGRGVVVTRGRDGVHADRFVCAKRAAGGLRPVLDLNSHKLLAHLAEFGEVKCAGTFGRLEVTASARGVAILKGRRHAGPFRVLDVFAGGGTLSDAFCGNVAFDVVAGVEIDPAFYDEFSAKHPHAEIVAGDFRRMMPAELPEFEVLVAGIPCSEHSNQGRAKKGLAKRPELGELGDLFVPVLGLVAARMPAACVFENVPLFGTSLAGATMVANLRRLGYHVAETVIEPHAEWGEPTTRARWVCVATLRPGFEIVAPGVPFSGRISEFLDAPEDAADRADASRIAVTIAGLRVHNARHAAAGHGFAISVLDGSENSAPVICKSYHKINSSGFFVATPYGPRMLRKAEIERLHGQRITSDHYATAVAMMGQGVLTRCFSKIFRQLGEFLTR